MFIAFDAASVVNRCRFHLACSFVDVVSFNRALSGGCVDRAVGGMSCCSAGAQAVVCFQCSSCGTRFGWLRVCAFVRSRESMCLRVRL